jgi:hypothetical protein
VLRRCIGGKQLRDEAGLPIVLRIAVCQMTVTTMKGVFIMRLGKYLMAAAVATMAVAPAVAAPANPAASLSVAKSARAGSASAKKNELAGGGLIVALIAAAAVVAGVVIVADSDDDADSN